MNKKQRKKFNRYPTISMLTFLVDYVGITEQLDSLQYASFKDIKFLGFSNVVPVSFEDIDNDVLATGDVLLVTDSSNNVAPFLNPFRIDDIINDNQEFVSELPHINCKVKKKKI